MTKIKWFKLTAPCGLASLGEILASHRFKRGHESGVELTETSRNTIIGRFIEEKVETEILIDPFGEEIRNEVLRFTVFGFSISRFERRVFLLRITDPPRNLKSFVDFLARIVGFGLSVDALSIDVQGFLADLRGYPGATLLRIRKIRLGTIRISDATLARMDAVSTSDALADVSSLVSLAGTVVEKATVSFYLDESLQSLEVAATGMIYGNPDLLESLTPLCARQFWQRDHTGED